MMIAPIPKLAELRERQGHQQANEPGRRNEVGRRSGRRGRPPQEVARRMTAPAGGPE
jgi:hypothetical protein